jgi:Fe-S-cluster containining protein
MSALPIIDSCNDCGACCMEQGSPPGYAAVIFNSEGWPKWTGDHDRVSRLPEDVRQSLLDHLTDDRRHPEGPCCWFDEYTGKCRNYEYRPQICRQFEVGSLECREWRLSYKINEQ